MLIKLKKFLMFAIVCANVAPVAAESESGSGSCSNKCLSISQNLWQPHAFSNYASQEILIMKGLDLDAAEGSWLNRFGFTTEYMQSFNDDSCNGLGAMPFWSGTNTMTIGNHNGDADLDAYQFGMGNVEVGADGIGGTITLAPKVQHVGTELLWYGMQTNKNCGVAAYAKIKVPLGAMMMTSNVCEVGAVETLEDLAGNGYVLPILYYPTLTAALKSGTVLQDPTYSYGKLAGCKQTTIRFGDITVAVGANFVEKEDGLFAVGAKFSFPTGNVPQAIYMLEPIFGRAGHWGVGGELFGQYTYHLSDAACGAERSVRVWFQGEVMHLFNGRTGWRSFDLLANGKGSKYLLLQHYNTTQSPVTADDFEPAIDYTTLPVVSSFGLEGNFALSVDFRRENWNLAVVGELWGRSKENLAIHCCALDFLDNQFVDFDLNHYAVAGRQYLNGALNENNKSLTWCEPLAHINQSQDAYTGNMDTTAPAGIVDGSIATNRIPSDYNKALDICGAQAQSIMTGKISAEFGYTWRQHCHVPNVSIFGGAELAGKNNSWTNLWSVGLQASLQF